MTSRTLQLSLVAAVTFSVLAAGGCDPAGATRPEASSETASPGEYTVGGSLDAVHGAVRVLVNGFPPVRLPTDGVIARYAPGTGLDTYATPALVSGRNGVAVEVVPALYGSPSGPRVDPVRFRVWVEAPDGSVVPGTRRSAAHVDSVVAAWTADLRDRWAGWGPAALDSARAWAAAHPVRVEAGFVRPGGPSPTDGQPSFDAVFRDAAAIPGTAADSARLRAYAARLLRLNADRDTAALMSEFGPSVSARFRYSGTPLDSAAFYARNRRAIVHADPAPLGPDGPGLRSWSGGRVWELAGPGGQALIRGAGGIERAVYVGLVGGELRVVR